jgi:glutamate dehydrogenase/leucine dehydrogenase
MAPDVGTEKAFRLARAMTFKNATAGLPHGGGKSVIFADPKMPLNDKERLIRAFAAAIGDVADYIPGPDMGTDELAMGWIKDETSRAVGLPREIGGIPLDEIGATGFGLAIAIDVAREHIGLPLAVARVVVQGFGSVGNHAARFLAEKGAVLVAAGDTSGTIADEDGLDLAALVALKAEGRHCTIIRAAASSAWMRSSTSCAISGSPRHGRMSSMPTTSRGCRPGFSPKAATFRARWRPSGRSPPAACSSCPIYIANAGGVICAAIEYRGGTEAAALALIAEKIRANTEAVLDEVRRTGVLPRTAALSLATGRVRRAMRTRRWDATAG